MSEQVKPSPELKAAEAPLQIALDAPTLEYLSITELQATDVPYVRADLVDIVVAALEDAAARHHEIKGIHDFETLGITFIYCNQPTCVRYRAALALVKVNVPKQEK